MADTRIKTSPRARPAGGRGRSRRSGGTREFEADKPVCERAAEATLEAFSIPVRWSADVRAAVSRLPERVEPGRYARRKDLRQLPLVTIDGATARDFDDAVFAETREEGWRLVVAIADVAHYVRAGTALDEEAWKRGTSVYLPDRVVPMLPEALSNNLCSLRPREARLALVCDMAIDRAGTVTGYRFDEAVIRSRERMTYAQIASFLSGEDLPVAMPVAGSIRALAELYRTLRQARERRGALDFDTPESALRLENGIVAAITPVIRNDAHRLIEEAMIAANVCAARFLERHEREALYRVHEGPEREKAEQLASAFAACGIRWSPEDRTPAALQGALRAIGGRGDAWLFEMLVLRAMQQAEYRPEPRGHFGLAVERYVHFTSPIRRYPDLVVHRAIKRILKRTAGQVASRDRLVAAGEQSSMTERRAEDASRRVDTWLKCDFLAERIGETFSSVVAGVTDFGLFVDLQGFYVQGLLHVSELGADYYHYRPASMSLVGESSGARFTLGDELEVRLTDVQPELGRLDLVLASAPKRGRRRRGRGNGRGRRLRGVRES
ncbi:MAG: ribonuclease R [Gammaproteobacteria bacterium]|nr:ribonuclease R [Gammaproteobacteria bacterium]MDE0366953.1 ribonuclease R [Gammaproteobacteria bacterium]